MDKSNQEVLYVLLTGSVHNVVMLNSRSKKKAVKLIDHVQLKSKHTLHEKRKKNYSFLVPNRH